MGKEHQRVYSQRHPDRIAASQKKWKAAHPEAMRASHALWKKRHPLKVRAHRMVNRATKAGWLIRSAFCQLCGAVGATEGHHADYSKPLDVVWLCGSCHRSVEGKCRRKGFYSNE